MKYIDIENATFSITDDDRGEYGDDFYGGVLLTMDKLCELEEDIVRCKDCTEHQICKIEQRLGWYGYCSDGTRKETT